MNLLSMFHIAECSHLLTVLLAKVEDFV